MLTLQQVRVAVQERFPHVSINVNKDGSLFFDDGRYPNAMVDELSYQDRKNKDSGFYYWVDNDGKLCFHDNYLNELFKELPNHLG